MILAQKAELYNDLIRRFSLLNEDGKFQDEKSLVVRGLMRDCTKLMRTDALQAWVAYTCAFAFAGQVEESVSAYRNVMALSHDEGSVLNASNALTFLGFHQAVRENVFLKSYQPCEDTYGMIQLAMRSGCVHAAYELITRGAEMRVIDADDYLNQIAARNILADAGINDSTIAEHLDVAGIVWRRLGISPKVRVHVQNTVGIFSGVTYLLHVNLSAEQIFQANVALAEEESDSKAQRNNVFDIVFVGMRDGVKFE
ncbi:hypothetical protein KDM87_14965 [Undibacterium sp. FT147W]|uniref:Uncharacterized protein n=1 Tax=Undibacterium rivi TaxID=2828729 RepID=A0ABS5H4Y2_9BURK|nr:hypothetical protein [Undibacterium rivi]MBR7793893.1 hypothetical protein [Undibacterium rivi]